ncbi:MAG: lysylphosphatidylglycerol synthase transmembrane domain-containing protein [Myxococcota bacterium]|nr:lysylphosphatidylglycerol synthase transmembrane domain-containing protein [Myxococcota bacterium]
MSKFMKYLGSVIFGGLLVWLAFKDEDWSTFGAKLQEVDLGPILAYLALFSVAHILRIFRWGVLVRALGPVPWRAVAGAGAVGYMCIMVFPLRLGEFVRPYLIRRIDGVTASGALATVVVERVIDGLIFVGLFFVFITLLPPSGHPAVSVVKLGAYLAGAVFVTTLAVLIFSYVRRRQTVNLISSIGGRISPRLTVKLVGLLESFLDGLRVLPDRRRLMAFMLFTAVYWTALGVGMKWVATGVHIFDLTYTGGFALLTVLTVGIMIPAGPGFAGTFEMALKAGFALLIMSPGSVERIVLYTVILHLAQLVVQVGFGALWLLTGQVDISGVFGRTGVQDHGNQVGAQD